MSVEHFNTREGRGWRHSSISIKPGDTILIGVIYTNEPWETSTGERYLEWDRWANADYSELPVNTEKNGSASGQVIAMKEVLSGDKKYKCNQWTLVVIQAPKSIFPKSVYKKSKKLFKTNEDIPLKVNYTGRWPNYEITGCQISDKSGDIGSWVIKARIDTEWHDNIFPYRKLNNEIKNSAVELQEWIYSKLFSP